MNILVCNAGSSSLKLSLFEDGSEAPLVKADVDWAAKPAKLRISYGNQAEITKDLPRQEQTHFIGQVLHELQANVTAFKLNELQAVAHRVVHGGERFVKTMQLSAEVKQSIAELSELAPLHNSSSLEVIEAFDKLIPKVPQVAAFDTAFHATLSEAARTYAVPLRWMQEFGLRRYGFHGLSHAYCAGRAKELLGEKASRLIVAHLGNGASVSAIRDGVCVDTSMGFTPMEGLVMATRSGSIDPGALIYLLREKGLSVDELDRVLNHESGLLGVSGVSSDMRQVLAAQSENANARLAVEIYVRRVCQTIGAMASMLNGMDALVFTAGVGERSSEIRERVCKQLTHLNLELERTAQVSCKPDCDIATKNSQARVLVIATREDLSILRDTRRLLNA